MKVTSSIVLLLIAAFSIASSAPQSDAPTPTPDQQTQAQAQNQAQIDRIASAVQRIQNLANGLPAVTNVTQQLLNELQQFRQSELFFTNPCSFFQMIFRQFYCMIASFDPQRSNAAIQATLQFLNANQMFYNFASNFFCPFAAFGSLGGSSTSSNGPITCTNTNTPNTNGNTNANSNSLLPGFAALDSPQAF